MKKVTREEMKQVVAVAAKYITAGKDKEAVIKKSVEVLMQAGVTSFDFFDLKSFDDSLEARIVNVMYKLMCKVETLKHQTEMSKMTKAGKASPATAAQRRAQMLFDEQVRLFNEQNMINNMNNF